MAKHRVSYFVDNRIGDFDFGELHPMKPHRINVTHNLILAYGLDTKMDIYKPRKATPEEFRQFHAADYIEFLQKVTPDNAVEFSDQLKRFHLEEDCPVFDGLFEYCQIYTGGSTDGARKLISGSSDVAINWSGGMHHAKKSQAGGFCYMNDIVLSILELLKSYPRVLYIDIDAHHGDAVEDAFKASDRVMTVSFHHFEDGFFPGTGDVGQKGAAAGENYAVNCPLKGGIGDENFESLFRSVINKVMEVFRPSAVVLQCGTDSIGGDPLGKSNLTIKGHGKCVRVVKGFNIPTLVLGGGGYDIQTVTRCWTYETALLLEADIEEKIPDNDYMHYFDPDRNLHLPKRDIADENSREYLEDLKQKVMENLQSLTAAPSVELQDVPSTEGEPEDHAEGDEDPDAN